MKVEIITLTEAALEERDYCDILFIKINGKKVFEVSDGEPEDNNLGRNFNDCYQIRNLLEMAHEAGKKQEELSVTASEVDEI